MGAEALGEVPIHSESDIVVARKAAREVATQMGFGITDVTRIITAASELARNIHQYAGSGRMRWRVLQANDRTGLELIFEDHGPGIADIDQVLQEGFTTSGGLGMGLSGAKRLMGELEIQSEVGKGTTVTVRKWRRQ